MPPTRHVAIYARVSTKTELQKHSIVAQVTYLKQYVSGRSDLVLTKVYMDNGCSGTSMIKRPVFNRMIGDIIRTKEEKKDNEINLILVKSISRFSRNTLELLQTIRQLKELDVEVYFLVENISSLDPKCELLLSILSGLTQEESRNLSEDIQWGIRRRMENGNFSLPYVRFLGYKKGKDGRPAIVAKEARIIKRIYYLYLNGLSIARIANIMNKKHIPTPGHCSTWKYNTIYRILTNEKYKGEALLQKTYTADYLTHKVLRNNGERRKYYVTNSHPPIIEPEVWERVQKKMR